MQFYKVVFTKELHNEKWVEIDGQQKKLKSILLSTSSETSAIYKSYGKAVLANKGREQNATKRKNKKTEIVGKQKWGVDEVLHLSWKVQEVEVPKENITKFEHSGDMLVEENGKIFIVHGEKEIEKN